MRFDLKPEYRDGAWRLDDPKFAYLTEEQVDAYLHLEESQNYEEGMHDAERMLLEKHKSRIVFEWPEKVAVVDLGCGRGEKTLKKVAEAREQGKKVVYHPLDISDKMLALAVENATKEGIEAYPHNELIENFALVAEKARESCDCVYLNLGATISNFPWDILNVFSEGMEKQDFLYVSVQLQNEDNREDILGTYSVPEFWRIVYTSLKQLGFGRNDFEYRPLFVGDRVEFSSIIKHVPERLVRLGMKPGDRIVTHNSRKPTLDAFKKMLGERVDAKIWTNDDNSYAIAVCQKKIK